MGAGDWKFRNSGWLVFESGIFEVFVVENLEKLET